MFLNLKRTLMSEVDSGSGNGAVVPTPAESVTPPQAQGDAVTLSRAELDAMIAESTAKAVAAARDATFAEARRTFAGSKKTTPKSDETAAPAPLSASEERTYLRGLDRFLASKGIQPNTTQYERAERQLLAERPESVESWASDYFDGYGTAKPAQQATAASAAKPATEHPISNRGAPAPVQTPLEELDLFTASDSDRQAYIRAKGAKAYVSLLQKQAKGRTVSFK